MHCLVLRGSGLQLLIVGDWGELRGEEGNVCARRQPFAHSEAWQRCGASGTEAEVRCQRGGWRGGLAWWRLRTGGVVVGQRAGTAAGLCREARAGGVWPGVDLKIFRAWAKKNSVILARKKSCPWPSHWTHRASLFRPGPGLGEPHILKTAFQDGLG
jgi:hypothetical protein